MIRLAIVGVTGMVGRAFIQVLEERNLPIKELYLFASERSAGKKVVFKGKEYVVEALTENSFDRNIDIALFSAGGDISKKFAPIASSKGCIVIDNSSTWRMDNQVPLVVPEVNPEDIFTHKGIIANPNCSTIQAMVALKPLDDKFKIKRIIYSTYQAVSGAGQAGCLDLQNGLKGQENKCFPYQIATNCIPHIDVFTENGYTKEELKMINETKKILHNQRLKVTATTVRVPILNSHSESINVEFFESFEIEQVFDLLKNSKGLVLVDDIKQNKYPIPELSNGTDNVYVGRVRRDESVENGLNLWVVADNIRKGAATNAIQIAEEIIKKSY